MITENSEILFVLLIFICKAVYNNPINALKYYFCHIYGPCGKFHHGTQWNPQSLFVTNLLLDASAHGEIKLTYFTSINTIIYLDIL